MTVPLGPRSFRSGFRKPGSWSSRSSCCSRPAWRAKARVCAGSRRPTTSGALPRACGGCGPVASGRSAGFRPTGSAVIVKRDAQLAPRCVVEHGGAVAQRAAPGGVGRAAASAGASSGCGSKATRAPAVGRQAREALVEGGARVAWPTGAARRRSAASRSAGARRDDDHPVARGGRRALGRPRRGRVGGEGQPRLAGVDRHGGAPADERVGLVGGQRAMRDARRELLDRQRHERLARVEVEDDVGRARRARRRAARPWRPASACRRRPAQQEHDRHHRREERERGEQQRGAAAEHRRHGSAHGPRSRCLSPPRGAPSLRRCPRGIGCRRTSRA